MKKKLFSILLSLAMVITMMPAMSMTSYAAAEDPFASYIEWGDDPAEKTSMPNDEGNYKLVADITINDTWNVPQGNQSSTKVTNLCLNGYALIYDNVEPYGICVNVKQNSELNIYDTENSMTTHWLEKNDKTYSYVSSDSISAGAVNVIGGLITSKTDKSKCIEINKGTVNMYGGTIAGFSNAVTLMNMYDDVDKPSSFNMYDGKISYNYSDMVDGGYFGYGSAVFVDFGQFTMTGGELSHNYATWGGAVGVDDDPNASFVMTGGIITDNIASLEGGGVYVYTCGACVAEDTLITMYDGSKKPVQELKTGDMLRIFDHKTGDIGTAPLLYFLDHKEKRDGGYTLHFDDGNEITAVGRHCFFEREANNYIMLNPKTANNFIGHEFYNSDEQKWEKLESVTILDEPVYCYSLMTALGNNANTVTNGLLSSELRGIFDYDEALKIDEERLAADIEKFGLMKYENQDYFSQEVFEILEGQYLNLIIGRGVLREDEVYSLLDSYADCFIKGEKEKVSANNLKLSSTKYTSFGVPAPDGSLYIGGTAVIKGNYGNEYLQESILNESNRIESNVFLGPDKMLTFGEGEGEGKNGYAVPEKGMCVGVNKDFSPRSLEIMEEYHISAEAYPAPITTNSVKDYERYIFSDNPNYYVNYVNSDTEHLELKAPDECNNIINIKPSDNGMVKSSVKETSAGATVTLTVTPDEGYELDTLTVKDASGNSVTVSNNQFVMPSKAVIITVEFKEKSGDNPYGPGGGDEPTPAESYTVKFDLQGHGLAINDVVVNADSKLTKPTDPTASGWTFGGWYKEKACINAWNFTTDTVKSNMTLYAKWTQNGSRKVPVEILRAKTSGKRAIKLSWKKVAGVTKYVVYGNRCGKKYKKLKTFKTKRTYMVNKIKGKKLKAHKTYKFYVVAYTDNGKVKSRQIKFITGKTMGKYANVKSIEARYDELQLSVGSKLKIGATYKMYKGKKHLKKFHGMILRYRSNRPSVARVSKKGVLKAVGKGTATIYIQDIGGKYCKTKVTVE